MQRLMAMVVICVMTGCYQSRRGQVEGSESDSNESTLPLDSASFQKDDTDSDMVQSTDSNGGLFEENNIPAPPGCEDLIAIPDEALRTAVEQVLSASSGGVSEGKFTYDSLKQITSLTAEEVSDLTGVHCMTGLRHLDLYWNRLQDLAPLRDLSNLTYLDLYPTMIGDGETVYLKKLVNLTYLDLGYDAHLYGQNSSGQVRELDFLVDLVKLAYLNLSNNDIIDISPLADNPGIGAGDEIDLTINDIDCEDPDTQRYIALLEERGAHLIVDCENQD